MEEILIYDVIGAYGSEAKSIIAQLDESKGKDIVVRINSVGGDVFEGMAIYNALLKHEGKVSVEIEGLAASMASIIMLAGDTVSASENSLIMLHNPSAGMQGESKDLKKRAELLDKMKTQMVSIYAGKTDMAEKDVIKMMDEETWFTSAEAQNVGLIDNVTEAIKVAAHFDLNTITNKVPEWVEKQYNLKEDSMENLANMLGELKETIKAFISEQPKEVKIIDEESIQNQIVDLSEKITEVDSIHSELEDIKGLNLTMEETIKTLTEEKENLETEINKHNATPSEVEKTEDPVIVTEPKKNDPWSDAATILGDDSAFSFKK
jgi:ATP-dependent Clp endopeptidase proteolytic subunit ClpP